MTQSRNRKMKFTSSHEVLRIPASSLRIERNRTSILPQPLCPPPAVQVRWFSRRIKKMFPAIPSRALARLDSLKDPRGTLRLS